MHEVLEAIVIDLQALDGQLAFERVGIELPHFIVIDIELFQLFEVFQAIDLDDFVAGGLQDLQFA